tara:strand:- start:750 stop:1400 length:651 start_codon:yes stop_codon:yes gene_type:complete
MKLSQNSIQTMDEFAKTFSDKVQKRVFRRAGVKASEAMVEKIKSLVPVSDNPSRLSGAMHGPGRHARDSVAYKVKAYNNSGRVLFIMGYRSNGNPLATLMEKSNFISTQGRFTKHKTKYVRRNAGFRTAMVPKQRRDGTFRSVREQVRKQENKRSVGSFATGQGKPAYRGHFPRSKVPYAPITNAARAMRSQIIDIMEAEIAAGFERAFAREAGAF